MEPFDVGLNRAVRRQKADPAGFRRADDRRFRGAGQQARQPSPATPARKANNVSAHYRQPPPCSLHRRATCFRKRRRPSQLFIARDDTPRRRKLTNEKSISWLSGCSVAAPRHCLQDALRRPDAGRLFRGDAARATVQHRQSARLPGSRLAEQLFGGAFFAWPCVLAPSIWRKAVELSQGDVERPNRRSQWLTMQATSFAGQ